MHHASIGTRTTNSPGHARLPCGRKQRTFCRGSRSSPTGRCKHCDLCGHHAHQCFQGASALSCCAYDPRRMGLAVVIPPNRAPSRARLGRMYRPAPRGVGDHPAAARCSRGQEGGAAGGLGGHSSCGLRRGIGGSASDVPNRRRGRVLILGQMRDIGGLVNHLDSVTSCIAVYPRGEAPVVGIADGPGTAGQPSDWLPGWSSVHSISC